MKVEKGLMYSKSHEWIKEEGDEFIIGITDYAQSQLGDIVFVELPAVGAAITAGKRFSVVESVKAVSDIFAPINGKVVEINEALNDTPEKVNQDPYGDGWMIKVKMSDPAQIDELLDAKAYAEIVQE